MTPAIPARLPIRALNSLLVNQIAAGEVVERPASVIKELLENAIDAAASRIVIELEDGGVELIRISDNGWGIPADQLPLALASHATNKIRSSHDLDSIETFGFRGEALASIASVSRLTIRSRARDTNDAWQIDVEGDVQAKPKPVAGPTGTTLTVRNLFYNTPARRKFLKTPRTEKMRCMEVIRNCALANPWPAFEVLVDGKQVLDLPCSQEPFDRAVAVLGKELQEQVIKVEADEFDNAQGLALWGLVGLPAIARGTARAQHFFINGRPIRDRTIAHALAEAYRGLAEPGRYPTAVLMLAMSPEGVDVNVHPQKAEVRFRDQSKIHSVVFHAVRDALAKADLTPRFSLPGRANPGGQAHGPEQILPGHPSITHQHNQSLSGQGFGQGHGGSAAGLASFLRGDNPSHPQERLSYDAIRQAIERIEHTGTGDQLAHDDPSTRTAASSTASIAETQPEHADLAGPDDQLHDSLLPAPEPANRILQVHNSYLLTQDAQGVLIIDQHALHERVMFELLLARVSSGTLESQQLLVPALIKPSSAAMEGLDALGPLLKKIGIEVAPIGPKTLGVRAFATFLFERKVDPVDFLTDLFEKTEQEGFVPDSEEALREVLDMMACKAAVKAGDHMSEEELQALLTLRGEVERSSNCPHGRPTTIRLSIGDLERLFGRT